MCSRRATNGRRTSRLRCNSSMLRCLTAMTLALMSASASARADAISDFYRGRTVNLVIGYPPGGGYDLYARTLARHIGRHIPGNPSIVVKNMPGPGAIKAANYLDAIGPKGGWVVGGCRRPAFPDPLLGRS